MVLGDLVYAELLCMTNAWKMHQGHVIFYSIGYVGSIVSGTATSLAFKSLLLENCL